MQSRNHLAWIGALLLLAPGCIPGGTGVEAEPNDTPGEATLISNFGDDFRNDGTVVEGSLTPGDVDYWKIEVVDNAVLTFSLDEPDEGEFNDPQIAILDPSGNVLVTNDDGGRGFLSRVSAEADGPGFFFVAVTGFGDDAFDGSHQQTLSYKLVAGIAAPQHVLTELEEFPGENDDPSQAEPLPHSIADPREAVVVSGRLEPGDVDHYSFPIGVGKLATAAVYDEKAGQQNDTVMLILDENGDVVAEDDDSGPGFLSNVRLEDAPPGTYRIALSGFTGAEDFVYRLVVSVE